MLTTRTKYFATLSKQYQKMYHPEFQQEVDDHESEEQEHDPEIYYDEKGNILVQKEEIIDPILREANIGWRNHPGVPDVLIDNIREIARQHNVKRINEKFDTMEEQRLEFSLQELDSSLWFRKEGLTPDETKELSKTKKSKPNEYGPEESLAYTVRRTIPIYTVLSRVFAEVSRRMGPTFQPASVLDYGAGPGTVVWSADTVWPNNVSFKNGQFTLIDNSQAMKELSSSILISEDMLEDTRTNPTNSMNEWEMGPNIRWRTSLRDLMEDPNATVNNNTKNDKKNDKNNTANTTNTNTALSTRLLPHHQHDIVLASNMISELPKDKSRDATIELLWRLTAPGGVLIIVERGNRWGSSVAARARQLILELDPKVAQIVAPCTHSQSCPMIEKSKKQKSWCHFAHRTGDEDIRKIVGNRSPQHRPSYDKFSYIVIQKKTKNQQKKHHDRDNKWDFNVPWGRIIKPPLRRGKHVIVDVCGNDGLLQRKTFGKRRHKEGGVYRAARRSEWGALWGKDKVVLQKE